MSGTEVVVVGCGIAGATVVEMLRVTEDCYRELEGGSVDFRWTLHDEVLIARDEQQQSRIEHKAAVIGGRGIEVQSVSGDELRAEFPAFGPDVLGGQVLAGASTVEAESATRAYAEAARVEGSVINTANRVGKIIVEHDRVCGVLTDQGRVTADAVVVATGPWLTELLPLVAITAGRGWLMRTQKLAFEGLEAQQRMARRALELAPGLARTIEITRAWWGLRPLTPDGLPLVGPGDVDGLYIHGGHASLGMHAAPATARWLAGSMRATSRIQFWLSHDPTVSKHLGASNEHHLDPRCINDANDHDRHGRCRRRAARHVPSRERRHMADASRSRDRCDTQRRGCR